MFDRRQIKTRLGRYYDGELPPAERFLVESHLHGRLLCSQELEDVREVSSAFQRTIVTPPVPEVLAPRISAQARACGSHFPGIKPVAVLEGLVAFKRCAALALS